MCIFFSQSHLFLKAHFDLKLSLWEKKPAAIITRKTLANILRYDVEMGFINTNFSFNFFL